MLAEIHKHINDSRISFDETEHNYFIDGQKAKFSVTEIIDKFFPEFDSAFWAERKAIEKLNQDHVEYDSEVLQATIKQILEAWERKRIDAASILFFSHPSNICFIVACKTSESYSTWS